MPAVPSPDPSCRVLSRMLSVKGVSHAILELICDKLLSPRLGRVINELEYTGIELSHP